MLAPHKLCIHCHYMLDDWLPFANDALTHHDTCSCRSHCCLLLTHAFLRFWSLSCGSSFCWYYIMFLSISVSPDHSEVFMLMTAVLECHINWCSMRSSSWQCDIIILYYLFLPYVSFFLPTFTNLPSMSFSLSSMIDARC